MTKLQISVVEDELIVAEDLQSTLTNIGYDVIAIANSGELAIEIAESKTPDLILMDIKLAGKIDGITAAERIRTRQDIPVIYVTAYANESHVQRMKLTSPFGYIIKPFNERELKIVIEMALYKHALEKKLKESEERFRLTLEATTDGIWDWNIQNNTIFFSPRWFTMLGYKPDELPGSYATWKSLIHPEDIGMTEQVIQYQIQQGRGSYRLEFRMRTKDGDWKWIILRGQIIGWDADNKPIRMVGTHTDNTERKRVEEALRDSEEFNRNLVESLPDYIVVYDFDGKILYVNPSSATVLGYDADKLVGTLLLSYIAEEYHREIVSIITEHKVLDEDSQLVIDLIRPNGLRRSVIVKNAYIQFHNNPAILILFIDITERKRAEVALLVANRKLNLLSSITRNDINNQLTVLLGFIEILKNSQLNPLHNKYVENIDFSAQRISSMIRFTKDYELIGISAPAWQDCHTLIATVAKEVPLGKVLMKNDIPAGTEVFADLQIAKVFYTLMDNAVRYHGIITTIRYSVKERDGSLIIICEDDSLDGPALEEEKIFWRGFGSNTGLGLVLAREILSVTGITISESNELGIGTRIEITVPKGTYRFGVELLYSE